MPPWLGGGGRVGACAPPVVPGLPWASWWPCWPLRRVPPSWGSDFARCGSRARANAFVGARTLGTLGRGLVRAAASVRALAPPLRLEAFLGAPFGRVRLGRGVSLWAAASTVLVPLPCVSAAGVRCCPFGSSQSGNGSRSLASRGTSPSSTSCLGGAEGPVRHVGTNRCAVAPRWCGGRGKAWRGAQAGCADAGGGPV